MRSWMIAFSFGILICGYIPYLPPPYVKYILLLLPFTALYFISMYLPSAFALGLFWFLFWAESNVEQLLSPELEQQDIWVRGVVKGLPQELARSQRFIFKVHTLCAKVEVSECNFSNPSDLAANTRLLKSAKQIRLTLYQTETSINPGQQWQFKVRLKRPRGFSNPGTFDYEAWLFQHEIHAVGYVREHNANRLLSQTGSLLSFSALRFAFSKTLDQRVNSFDSIKKFKNTNIIKALTIGDRNNIIDTEWKLFTATGTNHLIVISGLHVGLVAFMVYRISIYLISFFTPVLLCIPAQRSGAVIAVLAAFFYAGLAGFSLPSQRAFIMLSILMLGHIIFRNTTAFNGICLALALVLWLDPMAPHTSGFWLSFVAVSILIYLASKKTYTNNSPMTLWQKSQLLLQTQGFFLVGMLPLMLVFFQQQSLLAPFINFFAIPFVSLLVVPLCLLGLVFNWFSLPLSNLFLSLADFFISIFIKTLTIIINNSPNFLVELPQLSLTGFLLLTSVSLLFLFTSRLLIKLCMVVSLFGILFSNLFVRKSNLQEGEFNITVLEVGQGLAIVVKTLDHNLIYDAGPAFSDSFNAGAGVVIPYLRSHNINTVDRIIISHGDNDHSGGLSALLTRFPKSEYSSPNKDLFPHQVNANRCANGQHWTWNNVTFTMLHPDPQNLPRYSKNNSSCVLKVSSGEYSVLLSGDIEKLAETHILAAAYTELQADILIAPHHGSNTSSTVTFIKAVNPTYSIFSTGYLNRFNHPHPLVTERYQKQKVTLLNTALTGAIQFNISPTGIQMPLLHRQQRRRVWSSP